MTLAAPRRRVPALERASQILDHLVAAGRPATAYEIGQAIGAPLSTVYGTIEDLAAQGLLERGADGAVWLGSKLYHYGLAYARRLDLLSAASAEMEALSRRCGETVQICGRDGDDMVVLAMAEGPDHFGGASRVGTRTPLNWSASGRLLVGHLPEPERRAIFLRAARPSPTGKAETDIDHLVATARSALAERLCVQAGESDYSVACIASPIRDADGVCRATMSVVVPDHKVGQDEPDLKALVRDSARRVEERLGWEPRRR